eukprot:jgi/Chrzof1/12573/UNPLg00526.t1
MDVYAFGVLLWEMITGSRAWAGSPVAVIICQVACMKRGLAIPQGLPAELKILLERCLAAAPGDRPTFKEITATLQVFVQSTRGVDFSKVAVAAPAAAAKTADDGVPATAVDSPASDVPSSDV